YPSLPLLLPFPAQGIQQLPTIAIHHGRRNEKHRFIEIFHLATIVLRVPALPQLSHHTFHLCGIRGHLERLVTPYHHGNPILVRGHQYQPSILRIHVNLHFNLTHGSPFSKTCYKLVVIIPVQQRSRFHVQSLVTSQTISLGRVHLHTPQFPAIKVTRPREIVRSHEHTV